MAEQSAQSPYFEVYVSREDPKNEKTRYTRIGAMFPHKEGGGFSIKLDAHPIGNELVVFPPKPKPE